MSRDLNKFMAIGRIGQDIELRYLPNGNACANFSIAVGDDYKDKAGNKVEQTEWVRISAFGKQAENLSKYCGKGSKLYIEGKLKTRSFEKDGAKQYITEVSLSDFQMLDSKTQGTTAAQPAQAPAQRPIPQDSFNDDIPF